MDKKLLKSVVAQAAGAALACVGVNGYNPFGIGMYSAIMTSRLIKWPTVFIMTGCMLFFWSFLNTIKYALVMVAIHILLVIGKDSEQRTNQTAGAIMAALVYGAMEYADQFMGGNKSIDYGELGLVMLTTFAVAMVASRVIEAMSISGKRIGKNGNFKGVPSVSADGVFEDKIKNIAASFERISKSISKIEAVRTDDCVESISVDAVAIRNENKAMSQIDIVNEIWKNRMEESRGAIAMQLKEMANILKDCAATTYSFVNMGAQREKLIRLKLKNMGIIVKKIVVLNNRKGINEVNITLKAGNGKCVTIRQLEEAISKSFGKSYRLHKDVGSVVKHEYITYNLIEEPNYFIMYGVAKQGRDGSGISGDNFSCVELKSGQTLLSVSDGMGHGLKAYKESEMVLTLLEELMESGFSEEASLRLINSVFMVDGRDVNPASLDMGIIDMYSGVCDFLKIGAASTFVKRGGWVEAIRSGSMPIGSDASVDIESTSKKLYDGDYIIMMSDGIVDAIEDADKERYISGILMDIEATNPTDMAKQIMDKIDRDNKNTVNDDMLVMVAGIWDKCA